MTPYWDIVILKASKSKNFEKIVQIGPK